MKGRPRELIEAKSYALYLDAQTIEALRRAAQARGCSISQLVRELVREHEDAKKLAHARA